MTATERSAVLAAADAQALRQMAEGLTADVECEVLSRPSAGRILLRVMEPVENQEFYAGEVLLTECEVRLGTGLGRGFALGDAPERALHCAIIEAAVAGGHPLAPEVWRFLAEQAAGAQAQAAREQALLATTRVQFDSMEAQDAQHKGSKL